MAITFGVVTPTYRAGDDTFSRVQETLRSLKEQTYPHWRLYLIGDRYEPEEEFERLSLELPPQVVALNLNRAVERESSSGLALWCTGGRMANNIALTLQERDGITHTCHLDHDDLWRPTHLATLAEAYASFPQAAFIYTRALYRAPTCNFELPRERTVQVAYNNLAPRIGNIVHATASWRLDWIPLRYRAHAEEPADAYMWAWIMEWCKRKSLPYLYVPTTTVIKQSKEKDVQVYRWRAEAEKAKAGQR
jgi:hypothetical protein